MLVGKIKLDGEASSQPSEEHTVSCQDVNVVPSTVALTFVITIYYLIILQLPILQQRLSMIPYALTETTPFSKTIHLSLSITGVGQCCSLILLGQFKFWFDH